MIFEHGSCKNLQTAASENTSHGALEGTGPAVRQIG